jgi:anhydro-N-acetylmuramic acid kinase
VCDLDVTLGEAFADAALEVVARAGLTLEQVHLVGSHGQTAYHRPRSAGHSGATLQIGQGAVIAERTGLPVVCDFRVRDVAAGGEGAPLVPLSDWLLFRSAGRVRALQNIGGIANVTVVTARLEDVFAFDNAPGNMVLDAAASEDSGSAQSFDAGGERAARGRADEAVVAELLGHPFLAARPPKSTGRERFGVDFVRPLRGRFAHRPDDLLATLTLFVARAIAESYRAHVLTTTYIDEVLVSGGGVHNRTLMSHLRRLLAPMPVRPLDEVGVPADAKEAVCFAVLANETLHGHAGNVPAATGACGPRVLGKIVV